MWTSHNIIMQQTQRSPLCRCLHCRYAAASTAAGPSSSSAASLPAAALASKSMNCRWVVVGLEMCLAQGWCVSGQAAMRSVAPATMDPDEQQITPSSHRIDSSTNSQVSKATPATLSKQHV